jgi:hypothetical protein
MTPSVWKTIEGLVGDASSELEKVATKPEKGQLVVVGTGLASTRQFTLEVSPDPTPPSSGRGADYSTYH